MNDTMFFKRPFNSIAPEDLTPPVAASAVSPSLRVRVTTKNRSLLRWLRAAELAAWEEPAPATRRAFRWFKR